MSDRISSRWKQHAESGTKALIPYVTPDFPIKDSTPALVKGLENSGASFVEIGIPFSDPLADGPVIQHASKVALSNGATPERVFEIVRQIRTESSVPILLMGYVNPILRLGVDSFMERASESGVDGLIIPDLPLGESSDIHASSRSHDLSMVYLVAPTTSNERLREVDTLSTDFTYCVSMTGVTGASSRFAGSDELEEFLSRVKDHTQKPYVVGFGISSADDVERVWNHADGAVVGSQLLKEIAGCSSKGEVAEKGMAFLKGLIPPTVEGGVRS